MSNPFENLEVGEWSAKRDELIEDHPLSIDEIHELVLTSYNKLLRTRIGDPSDNIRIFKDVPVKAQTVGSFLETIIANELQDLNSVWRPGTEAEKDLIHTEVPRYSTEIKTSGQVNDEVFGNRSYAQDSGTNAKKSKSGYYITVNMHISEDSLPPSHKLFLIRFGWIDFDDWSGQKAATGQAARLSNEVYAHKLRVIEGEYMLNAPLELVHMIGPSTIEDIRPFLDKHGISTVGEFISHYESTAHPDSDLKKVYKKCKAYPGNTVTMGRDNMDLLDESKQTKLR